MKCLGMFALGCVLSATTVSAQEIPAGTALPVMLNSSLDAKKSMPGEKISGRLMQDVLLPDGARIRAGAQVTGEILQVDRPTSTSGSRLVLRFDELVSQGHSISLTTNLRAIASMTDIFEAQLPTNNFDEYGTSIADWTTIQVGGDVVYRGSGQVFAGSDSHLVGRATGGGDVTAQLTAVPNRGCRGPIEGNNHEQSLWLFSTSACGPYGFSDLKIAHADRTNPTGEIVLESASNVLVRGGSGVLLRVQPPPQ